VSLREQFAPDIDHIFINPDEMAEWREFRISDGHNGWKVFTAKVVWDDEQASEKPIVKVHGVYLADVICHIADWDLPRAPVAGELIYSPANQPYEVIDIKIQEHLYVIALAAYRSQPGHYGSN
jgi:hypothetical protein